jgi:membrane protease subunit (stomatin/prohibitin family)
MAWFEREFIAVPEDRKRQIVFKWPDVNIRRYSRVIVNADELALFVKAGHVIATMGPGRHRLDADQIPVLGGIIDALSGGRFYRAELYFIASRELTGIKFGGRMADVVDPRTEQVISLRVFGELAMEVRDPVVLITELAGTTDLADPEKLTSWCADQLLKAMKIAVTRGISAGRWPVVGISAFLPDIEEAVVQQTNVVLYDYGLRIQRLGNFDINLAPEDAERLKRLAKDIRYIDLAGGFERYAAGELALGAGHGLARGGVGDNGGFLGAAIGLPAIRRFAGDAVTVACPACHAGNGAQARFCGQCGAPLDSAPQHLPAVNDEPRDHRGRQIGPAPR